jgi:hypothetical protein
MGNLILKNAIDSISMGLEDFKLSEKDERRITSCTRNILSGILLLFKYKLSILSPEDSNEALIKKDIFPIIDEENKIVFRGSGHKTIDVHGIKARFESLKIHVSWKNLDKIIEYRNKIEHYYSHLDINSAKTMISESFVLIKGFIEDTLMLKPEKLFDKKTWLYFANTKQVHDELKEKCNSNLEKLDYYSIDVLNVIKECKCKNCGSDLISVVDECEEGCKADNAYYICKVCNKNYNYKEIIELYLESTHELIKDGEEIDIDYCPICHRHSFLYNLGLCLLCGENIDIYCKNYDCEELVDSRRSEYCERCNYLNNVMLKDD